MAKKLRIKWKVVAPLAIGVLLCVYLVVSIISSIVSGIGKKDNGQIYTLCTFNKKQTLNAIAAEDKEHPVGLMDFNFYGESLNFFFEDYTVQSTKSLEGKTVVLKDMCSSEEIVFENISSGLDNMINVGGLKVGYYAVYIKNGETLQRVYMYDKLTSKNTFTTISRNGKAMKIELVADKSMFNTPTAEEDYLDRNYLYISVTEVTEFSEFEYDIAIVTAPALTTTKVSLVGEEIDGTSEAKELNDVAIMIEQQLTEAGYRVMIVKEAFDEDIQYYGSEGVLGRVYDAKAKYLIYLDCSIADSVTGVIYSAYTENALAESIFNELFTNTTLYKNESKLYASKTETSKYAEDGIQYDSNYEIREAGGKVLGAGRFSEAASKNSFASNKNGVNTVKIVPCNIKNAEQFNYFRANKELIAKSIANGIISYLK